MALTYVTPSGTLVIPGSVASITVASGPTNIAANGIVVLVGEADAGPDWTLESDVVANCSFGPGQLGLVKAKYKTGNLVDAFAAAVKPSTDPEIPGAPSTIILLKTNKSTKASGILLNAAAGTYGTLFDQSYGKLGNQIYFSVSASKSESLPTTGAFAFALPVTGYTAKLRVNGGAEQTLTIANTDTPTNLVTKVQALSGVTASGGVNKAVLAGVAGTLALAVVSGNNVILTRSQAFDGTAAAVGDTLFIPSTSVLAAAAAQNAGSYVVTGVTAATISAVKVQDVASAGTVTPPPGKTATASSATTDVSVYGAVTIVLSSATIVDGLGKTLTIAEVAGADVISNDCFTATGAKVAWISKSGAPYVVSSSQEYVASLNTYRQLDGITENLIAGGELGLLVSYLGTTAQVVVGQTTISSSVTGGAGAAFPTALLSDLPTITDVANYISSFPGWTAAPGTGILGQLPSSALDEGTFTCGATFGGTTGHIKIDAYRFFNKASSSLLVQLGNPVAAAASGLPAPSATVNGVPGVTYLTGGAKGPTLQTDFTAAIDKLAMIKANFVVPLFSRDASVDIANALTESASNYTIDGINLYVKNHVVSMSTLKRKKNRQAILSKKDTFNTDKNSAANIAYYRANYCFQDRKDVDAYGTVKQFAPWMTAVAAASMQAAGFYKPIFGKTLNAAGFLQAAGDFDDQDDDAVEAGLLSGLMICRKQDDGSWQFAADYTTYGKDQSNFVYNSLQATYVADLIALTTAAQMEKMFKGKSVADVSASLALAALESIMANLLRLKLIAVSDDAPRGFKNAVVSIQGPAMIVDIEVKLAGGIYFIPVNFLVSQVQQTASA